MLKYIALIFFAFTCLNCQRPNCQQPKLVYSDSYQLISVNINTSINNVQIICNGINETADINSVIFSYDSNVINPIAKFNYDNPFNTHATITFRDKKQYNEYVKIASESIDEYRNRTDS